MKTSAKPSAYIAIVTVCALLFQFGACSYSAKPQSIPVTSNPAGARIIVDGQDAGTTPLNLSLTRDDDHRIRIEKPDYNPVDMILKSKSETGKRLSHIGAGLLFIPLIGLAGWAISGADMDNSNGCDGFLIGALVGTGVMFVSAGKSGQAWLSPSVVNVTLEKAGAQARTNVIILDRDQLKDIRWIRISCAEGGEAGVVAVN